MNKELTVVNVYCISCPYVWKAFGKVGKVVLTGLCPKCFYTRYGTFIKFAKNETDL